MHPGGVAGVVERAPGSFVHAARAPLRVEPGAVGEIDEELADGAAVALAKGVGSVYLTVVGGCSRGKLVERKAAQIASFFRSAKMRSISWAT